MSRLHSTLVYELQPLPHEVVLKKRRYSAFYGTELDLILRSTGMEAVISAAQWLEARRVASEPDLADVSRMPAPESMIVGQAGCSGAGRTFN